MDFIPRFLMATRPPGDDVYEVLVAGDDSVGVLSKITEVLSNHSVNFVSSHGQVDESGRFFVNVFFCEMSKAKVTPDELKKKLSALPFVRDVKVKSMKGSMYEEYMFPMSTMFNGRALVLGASAFAQIEGRLVEIFGSAGEVMAYEQGRAYAISTLGDMEDYRKRVGAVWDIENIRSWIRSQGWAAAEITEDSAGFAVRLSGVPASKDGSGGEGISRFLTGMTVGMLEYVAGQRLAAEATTFDRESGSYGFRVRKQPKKAP